MPVIGTAIQTMVCSSMGDLTSRLTMDFRFDYTQLRAVMPASHSDLRGTRITLGTLAIHPNLGGDPFNNSPTRLSATCTWDSGPEKNTLGGYAMTFNYTLGSANTLKDIVAYRNTTSTSPNSNVTGQGNLLG